MRLLLELILFFPLGGAVLQVLLGGVLPRRASEAMACCAVGGSFAATLAAAANYHAPVTVEVVSWLADFELTAPVTLYLDPLSLSIILMVTFVCGLIHLYSVAYMADDPGYVRFFALLNLFVAAMLLLVLAENLPLLYLGWEGVGFCSYGLIGFWYREEKNATAARKAFIVTRIGDIALGVAIVWLFQLFATLSIPVINESAFLMPVGMVVTPLGLLLLAGAMGKSAQLPLSVWLPDAMAGPTPVSALIHAATMVTAGVYLLMRLFPFISLSATVLGAIALTGALSAFYGASCALVQRDLKRVLAYSTISQIGYMMLGVGAGAISAATFHLIVHAFFKALLFLGAGCVITALRHQQDLFRMGGLRRSHPALYRLFLAGALCLAGFPLTGGFFSKDAILAAVWAHGGAFYGLLYLLALLTAFLTAFYTFRMVWLVFGGEVGAGSHGTPAVASPLPKIMELVLFPLALLAVCGGLFNLPAWLGDGALSRFLAPVSGTAPHLSHEGEIALQLVAAVAAIGGILLAGRRYGDASRPLRLAEAEGTPGGMTSFLLQGWYLDRLYDLLFVRTFGRVSLFLWKRLDEGLIDGSVDRFAASLGRSGELIGRWASGRVSLYLLSFAAGAALLVGWLVWGALG
jgi:NADH-quinone oxidoreductase subunit L